jgi:hypothetical protein
MRESRGLPKIIMHHCRGGKREILSFGRINLVNFDLSLLGAKGAMA